MQDFQKFVNLFNITKYNIFFIDFAYLVVSRFIS